MRRIVINITCARFYVSTSFSLHKRGCFFREPSFSRFLMVLLVLLSAFAAVHEFAIAAVSRQTAITSALHCPDDRSSQTCHVFHLQILRLAKWPHFFYIFYIYYYFSSHLIRKKCVHLAKCIKSPPFRLFFAGQIHFQKWPNGQKMCPESTSKPQKSPIFFALVTFLVIMDTFLKSGSVHKRCISHPFTE